MLVILVPEAWSACVSTTTVILMQTLSETPNDIHFQANGISIPAWYAVHSPVSMTETFSRIAFVAASDITS